MAVKKARRFLSLRSRVLLLVLVGFAAVSVPAYWGFTTLVNATVVQLGTLFAEKQVLFDRYRGLGALMQEVTLAETLTRSPVIRDWAKDEGNPDKQARAMAELEQYRASFSDHSYFFVVDASGSYYYNDAENSHQGHQFDHRLQRSNPRDGWYYTTVAMGQGCHLNVDHDDVLGVTKVWINCVIREGDKVLGVLGSGIDLTAFIRQVVDFPQTGVQSMFVDLEGAIQAHRDPRFIDYHSLTKAIETKRTIFSLLDRGDDRVALREMLKEVTSGAVEVRSRFMQVEGRRVLVGVGYLDRLGWYNVTLMDVDQIIDRGLFLPIGLLLGAMMVLVAVVIGLIFKRTVVARIVTVERNLSAAARGEPPAAVDPRRDEIGQLSQTVAEVSSSVHDNMNMLEDMVAERTAELQALAYRDQLTGICNRRGFAEGFDRVRDGARSEARLAMLLIDIDRFKDINDSYGHQAGDEVAVEVARRIAAVLRPSDMCGRWGGDEFIVLFSDLGGRPLKPIADAMKRGLSQPVVLQGGVSVAVTVSIGACLVEAGESLDQVADMADAALYRAKEDGRNRVVVYDPTRERSQAGQHSA